MRMFIRILGLTLLFLIPSNFIIESAPDGFYKWDTSDVQEQLNDYPHSIHWPDYLPIQTSNTLVEPVSKANDDIQLTTFSDENHVLSIQISTEQQESLRGESPILIDQRIPGGYVDNGFSKTLTWKQGDLYYELTYRSMGESSRDETVSKDKLIQTALAFMDHTK
ncbi:hypothetical protein N781_04365 [Pontibacillus halophilus JSM 076056 = DSM 19796]|uniref:DUF4367 domain-containing protein n=1 Tax=Pontibacillus halophilus JSM 076056 = DSM 19796 TaxID=1385510 RepID=A0A0A5GH93_9BACI|nr:hypothetical protein [Pontibacillus halophilus]KGX91399.1 hypothetical protein N781_04365 [Pontibacillus halophilus JSM 076056 = DSM 19796]